MAPNASQAALPPPAAGAEAARRDKVRIRFRKGGDLRLVSHHDLMHCFERMFRRAALPFHATEGFNPKPRMAFALSLALGIVGCEEVLEVELDEVLPPGEVALRLARQAPPGLAILAVKGVDRKVRAQVRRVCYRVPVPPEQCAGLPARITALLGASECRVERCRPQARELDVRPYLRDLRLLPEQPALPPEGGSVTFLEMELWVTPYGTARPQEILGLLGLHGLLDAGAVLERTKLVLHDEDPTPDGGPTGQPGPGRPAATEGKAARRPAPLLPGPLSFDS
jgi:radical SAM-linked protein